MPSDAISEHHFLNFSWEGIPPDPLVRCWVHFISVILLNYSYLPQKCSSITTSKLLPTALLTYQMLIDNCSSFETSVASSAIIENILLDES